MNGSQASCPSMAIAGWYVRIAPCSVIRVGEVKGGFGTDSKPESLF